MNGIGNAILEAELFDLCSPYEMETIERKITENGVRIIRESYRVLEEHSCREKVIAYTFFTFAAIGLYSVCDRIYKYITKNKR